MSSIKQQLKSLPDTPGVYVFYNAAGDLIYVGKASSLKSRVASYWNGKRNPRPIEDMLHEVARVETQTADSVLEALLLEARLIKKHQPRYNVIGKDDKSWNYLCITVPAARDEYPRVELVRGHDLAQKKTTTYSHIFGPFTSGLNLKTAFKLLRNIFHISTCTPGQKRPCLYYQLGICLGVCVRAITPQEYKKRVILPLILFLEGKKVMLLKRLRAAMRLASKKGDYEEAARLRDQVHALQHIQDVALLTRDFVEDIVEDHNGTFPHGRNLRVEGYDISHMSSTNPVASMVVFNGDGPVKSEYRRFKMRWGAGNNDVANLAETLQRRLKHREWPLPHVMLIDGGLPQVNAVNAVLAACHVQIPVVGIAKGPERKKNEFIFGFDSMSFRAWVFSHEQLLIKVRNEAHRFAVTYQRKLRLVKPR